MTRMRVDAADIRELGAALLGVADDLAAMPMHAGAGEGLPPGRARAALDAVLGNWLQVRHENAKAVAALGQAVLQAGTAYLQVEDETARSLVTTQDGP